MFVIHCVRPSAAGLRTVPPSLFTLRILTFSAMGGFLTHIQSPLRGGKTIVFFVHRGIPNSWRGYAMCHGSKKKSRVLEG